jgi:hypothetical protein
MILLLDGLEQWNDFSKIHDFDALDIAMEARAIGSTCNHFYIKFKSIFFRQSLFSLCYTVF